MSREFDRDPRSARSLCRRIGLAVGLAVGAGFSALTGAACTDDLAPGRIDYLSHCAACHGDSGRGDGPQADTLTAPLPDLTRLAAVNGGSFPETLVYQIIDGRRIVRSHGTPEMPVWGRSFARSGASEAVIEQRLTALVAYIESLQETAIP
jgi:mono/diheme cytochrome c family protein